MQYAITCSPKVAYRRTMSVLVMITEAESSSEARKIADAHIQGRRDFYKRPDIIPLRLNQWMIL